MFELHFSRVVCVAALLTMAGCAKIDTPATRSSGSAGEFPTLKVLDVGQAPHQIAFSRDGTLAYIAAAGSDHISIVDTEALEVSGSLPSSGVPLGVAVLDDGKSLGVSRFQGDGVARIDVTNGEVLETLDTGGGSSLFSGPLPGNQWLITSEEENQISLLDGNDFSIVVSHATGARPFPGATTSDGRKVFVPNYDDGTVSVIDLWNENALATVTVGAQPSGGVVLPGDVSYAVAIRGEDRVDLVNVGIHTVTASISEGIGDSPFSVVTSPDARFAFVNNTASHDISVIDLASNMVVDRLPVGEIPIVMAVHPDGKTLWVACEGSHDLHVLAIPPAETVLAQSATPTEVLVMGMTHDRHLSSDIWGLDEVEATIRHIEPDVVCVEIPPNRWYEAWKVYEDRGVIEDSRVSVFPEYVNVLFPLKKELGFNVEPCAGWTNEMNLLRRTRIAAFENEDRFATQFAAYQQAEEAVAEQLEATEMDTDDPMMIHSDAFDERTRVELSPYDEYMNDWIGPGGWTNINIAHYSLVEKAIEKHPGERILVTFGAAHKYWFMDQLRKRDDINLLDVRPFLQNEAEE